MSKKRMQRITLMILTAGTMVSAQLPAAETTLLGRLRAGWFTPAGSTSEPSTVGFSSYFRTMGSSVCTLFSDPREVLWRNPSEHRALLGTAVVGAVGTGLAATWLLSRYRRSQAEAARAVAGAEQANRLPQQQEAATENRRMFLIEEINTCKKALGGLNIYLQRDEPSVCQLMHQLATLDDEHLAQVKKFDPCELELVRRLKEQIGRADALKRVILESRATLLAQEDLNDQEDLNNVESNRNYAEQLRETCIQAIKDIAAIHRLLRMHSSEIIALCLKAFDTSSSSNSSSSSSSAASSVPVVDDQPATQPQGLIA